MPKQYNTTALGQAVRKLPKSFKTIEPSAKKLSNAQKLHLLKIHNIICPNDRLHEHQIDEWLRTTKTSRADLNLEA
jgi:hypothetical protein